MILRGMDNDSKKLVLELVYDWQYEQDRLCRLKYESVWAPLSLWYLMRMSHWSHMVLLVTGNDTLLKQHVDSYELTDIEKAMSPHYGLANNEHMLLSR